MTSPGLPILPARLNSCHSTSPSPKISRAELANIVAARMKQKRKVLPDMEEYVVARREPLRSLGFKIRAKFEGPEVRQTAGRLDP